ncbi:MAG: Copper-exporting P-type ATPase [Planctomycetes bacterium]|nr:Copper-exporting P-type ATPase [Planctomycetota bacterium]
MEALAEADVAAFDKTGTLTAGRPSLAAVEVTGDVTEAQAVRLAAAAESRSEHPLARAVFDGARERGLGVPEAKMFRAFPGGGVRAVVEMQTVFVGSVRFLRETGGVADAAEMEAAADRLLRRGMGVVAVARGGRCLAVLGVRDEPRPSAREAVARLRGLGLRPVLLTGDQPEPAAAAASSTGVEDVRAALRPELKLEAVRALRAEGRRVAMVGDGINDGPALAAADVGIAMGTGAAVSLESARAALLSDDLRRLADGVSLCRRTQATVRWNLLWAFGYNAVAIPFAAGVPAALGAPLEVTPTWAAAAMALSSVTVLANSLRLR